MAKDMRRVPLRRVAGAAIVVMALVTAWVWLHGSKSGKGSLPQPTATVRVAPIRQASVIKRLVAYGRVVAAPWAVHSLVEPFEVSISRVFVNRGQSVGQGATLLQVRPGPAARLALLQAQNDYRLAKIALRDERMRLRLKLATRAGFLRARKAFDTARLSLQIFQAEGLRRRMIVTAPVSGVVSHIGVEEGSTVSPGQALVTLIAGDRLEVRLGVEPEDVPNIRVGERVRLSSFEGVASQRIHGLVSVIARVMDPATHMINVFVTLPASNAYLLGEYVEGRFTTASPPGLVVPRSAVLPSGHHFVLYTVTHGRAVRHRVELGPHNGYVAQVAAPHLRAGMPVVVLGNYELAPGMRVRIAP
ncbi:MAG: efflux RND transporter periplasmic adaptor subunit [Acidiferrobacter sp.]